MQSIAFNVYLYTLKLDSSKPVKSITLPKNRDVLVLGMTLAKPSLFEGQTFACSSLNHPS